MDSSGKQKAAKHISTLHAGGGTYLCGGLMEGLKVSAQRKSRNPGNVCSIILLTDGQATDGPSTASAIIAEFEKSKIPPTVTHTFGFGSDHDKHLLNSISTKLGGSYYSMEDEDSVKSSFGDCLGGLVSVVAKDIHLAVRGENGCRIQNVRTVFEHKIDQGGICFIKITDIRSEEHRDILFAISIPAITNDVANMKIVSAKAKFYSTVIERNFDLISKCTISRPSNLPKNIRPNVSVDAQKNRIVVASVIQQALQLGEEGKLDQAKERFCIRKVYY